MVLARSSISRYEFHRQACREHRQGDPPQLSAVACHGKVVNIRKRPLLSDLWSLLTKKAMPARYKREGLEDISGP